MNYWHLQMIKGHSGEDDFSTEEVRQIVSNKNIIGTGEWLDNKDDQCKKFKDNMQVGDVVFVRHGGTPVALVEIAEKNSVPEIYENEHRIKLLSLYEDVKTSLGPYNGQTQGTLTRVANKRNPTALFIIGWHNIIHKQEQMNSLLNLLHYKKQIILQGPPGTGKTRTAKEIARALLLPGVLAKEHIRSTIKIGDVINSITNITRYTVTAVSDTSVTLKLDNHTTRPTPFDKIIQAYQQRKWEGGTTGGDAYEAAIAKYIFNNLSDLARLKLIQFHPAYSYEDFVRGISAKSNGTQLEYATENKLLGQFAEDAFQNYRRSSVVSGNELSKEQWIDEKWAAFVSKVESEVANNGFYKLTNTINIAEVQEDCFRYKGEDWRNSSRINFNDCKKLIRYYLDNGISEPVFDIDISKHAFYRKPYYAGALAPFLQENKYQERTVVPEELKNYVIIIDEINRANLPAVLGELIYALEYRGEKVEGMYAIEEDNTLILPPNLFIIGTMNTADRSVGHIDYAIRRRFAFAEVLPTPAPIKDFAKPKFKAVAELFIRNYDTLDWANPKLERSENLAPDFRPEDVWIGHSYFITKETHERNISEEEQLKLKLRYEVIPILKEYIKDGVLLETDRVKEIMQAL